MYMTKRTGNPPGRPKQLPPTQLVHVNLPVDLLAKLDAKVDKAREREPGMNRTEMIRKLLERALR